MLKKLIPVFVALSLVAAFAAGAMAQEDASKCAWKVTAVRAGKWANGNQKAALWPKGSFPIPVGVSERPDWYVNGHNCGKSQLCAGCGGSMRFLPNSSRYLKDNDTNTIMLKYNKPPCAGKTSSKSFSFKWSQVPKGGYKTFK